MNLNLRRHYPILIVLIVLVSVLTLVLGNLRVIAYTTQTEPAPTNKDVFDYTNDIALFDDSVVHSIQVILSEEDYDSMITTYQETGVKEYFKADVIIDGVRINEVGIRLKGNASLGVAVGGGGGFGNRNRPEGGQFPGGGQPPEGFDPGNRPEPPQGFNPAVVSQPGENFPMPGADQDPVGGGMGIGQQASEDQVKIPFMIKFDEYEDQTYQGYTAVSIRTYGTSYDEAILHEPVTNEAARLAGIPATETAYAGFRFNDEDEKLYVISELVNEEYLAKHFENADGVLYKAELFSTLNYQGEDPSSYANSFTQQTRINDADLAPLIDFMRFIDQADDATFERDLPKYLDVDAFATYLAVNSLLVNNDSMIGMNNNYYLYYDNESGQFTLLMWDTNESLGHVRGSTTANVSLTDTQETGGMSRGQNALLKRFMENETFKALYEQKLQDVYEKVYASRAMLNVIERYSALIHSVNAERSLVDIIAYDAAVEKLQSFISERMEYLGSLELLRR